MKIVVFGATGKTGRRVVEQAIAGTLETQPPVGSPVAERGEEGVISRRETPVVKIVPVEQPKKRVFGALKGKISLGPEFFDPLPEEELALWEGK